MSPFQKFLDSIGTFLGGNYTPRKDDLTKEPKQLASLVAPICAQLLAELHYPGAPQLKSQNVEALLEYMHQRAVELGVPLNKPISAKGFQLGFAEGLLAHPYHPVEVQGYVGLFTWLVVQYDDIVGERNQMVEEAGHFQQRFFQGKTQPNNLLEGIASMIREAHVHFDPVMANLVQISVLKFLTSNLLERHDGFQSMLITPAGREFPNYYRDMSGMDQAYAVFCYPKALYPKVENFLEAIPAMANFINLSNDVLSFYKEELGGDARNYIHNRALCTGKPVLTVVEEVSKEAIESATQIEAILKDRAEYEQSWKDSVRGYMALHTTNPRYRLEELGLGEEHPLAPFENKLIGLFEQIQ
ncbi:longiborneol synthase [Dactylonectria macrodidyma]|uniref:Longiborneol synthase n=1 Tax=Dactylonectria macrodidyma TaxID=307937 RepID=A0A9P9D691_9HYPO|nr:longiborneol synthase [Dactylonectria macrodidyma]